MTQSYHYRSLFVILMLAACSSGERGAPGTEPAVVPDVIGSAVPDAVRAVQGAGLRVQLAERGKPVGLGGCDGGHVTGQDEPARAELVRGSTVTLEVTGCLPPS